MAATLKLPDLFTVGHSTHDWETFVSLLDRDCIDVLIDVRSHPGSRRHPQFNRDFMQSRLGGRYLFMGDVLGGPTHGPYSDPHNFPKHHIGRRRPGFKKSDEQSLFPTWTNQGLYDYGVWMAEPVFTNGLHELAKVARGKRVAICCCEVLWWKCHRSMIADAWEGLGGKAFHCWPARVPQRHVLGNRLSRYEPQTQQLWTRTETKRRKTCRA